MLPSWLSAASEVRIPTRFCNNQSPSYYQVWLTPNRLDQQRIVELYFFDTRNDLEHTIEYFVQTKPPPSKQQNKITVAFQKDVEKKAIRIKIRDEESFLKSIMEAPED